MMFAAPSNRISSVLSRVPADIGNWVLTASAGCVFSSSSLTSTGDRRSMCFDHSIRTRRPALSRHANADNTSSSVCVTKLSSRCRRWCFFYVHIFMFTCVTDDYCSQTALTAVLHPHTDRTQSVSISLLFRFMALWCLLEVVLIWSIVI